MFISQAHKRSIFFIDGILQASPPLVRQQPDNLHAVKGFFFFFFSAVRYAKALTETSYSANRGTEA